MKDYLQWVEIIFLSKIKDFKEKSKNLSKDVLEDKIINILFIIILNLKRINKLMRGIFYILFYISSILTLY